MNSNTGENQSHAHVARVDAGQSVKTDFGMEVWSFIGEHAIDFVAIALGIILVILGWTKTGIGFASYGTFFVAILPLVGKLIKPIDLD